MCNILTFEIIETSLFPGDMVSSLYEKHYESTVLKPLIGPKFSIYYKSNSIAIELNLFGTCLQMRKKELHKEYHLK